MAKTAAALHILVKEEQLALDLLDQRADRGGGDRAGLGDGGGADARGRRDPVGAIRRGCRRIAATAARLGAVGAGDGAVKRISGNAPI